MTQFISARLLGHLKVGVFAQPAEGAHGHDCGSGRFRHLGAGAARNGASTRRKPGSAGLDIMVAVDTSNSMLAEDVPPNRLARAKLAALDLMRRARTDRLGLDCLCRRAFLECPLTLDDAAFSQSVDALDTHTISEGGTAIAEAIDAARKAFKAGRTITKCSCCSPMAKTTTAMR